MNRGNVYEWPSPTISPKSSPHVFITTKVSFNHWHRRLGHPALKILKNVVSSHSLPVSETTFDFCNSYLCNKSHWLPFEISSLTSSWPLELIYIDVWGPAPVISFDNYRYYVIFVDHCTKYIWYCNLKFKSEVPKIIDNFQKLVESFFNIKITTVYFDGGGEYQALHSLLVYHGIQHLTSTPTLHNLLG